MDTQCFSCVHVEEIYLDPSHVLEAPPVELNENLTIDVQLVGIIDQRTKELRHKIIPMLKVLWQSDTVKEITWETEASMRSQYPYLFPK